MTDNWKPIETAPKDNTRILICGVGFMKHPCVAYWNVITRTTKDGKEIVTREGWYNGRAHYWHTSQATHWMECPQLPTTTEKKNGI